MRRMLTESDREEIHRLSNQGKSQHEIAETLGVAQSRVCRALDPDGYLKDLWNSTRRRCENPKDHNYRRYGGRGVSFHREWRDFSIFKRDILAEIGPRPTGRYPNGLSKYSFDRINNDGNYEPGNVCWSTVPAQGFNRGKPWALQEKIESLERENLELSRRLARYESV